MQAKLKPKMSAEHPDVFLPGNDKLGKSLKTFSRPYILTCATTCPLLRNGCYADPESEGFRMQQLNGGAIRRYGIIPPIQKLKATDVLRLHVVGDFGLPDGSADREYIDGVTAAASESDAKVFTYTHGWRQWSDDLEPLRPLIQINASCDTAKDVRDAVKSGWRVAFHSASVDLGATYHYEAGERLLVCPAQRFQRIKCENCRLCWTTPKRVAGVAFKDHGRFADRVAKALRMATEAIMRRLRRK
jgi:hypothetical protein